MPRGGGMIIGRRDTLGYARPERVATVLDGVKRDHEHDHCDPYRHA